MQSRLATHLYLLNDRQQVGGEPVGLWLVGGDAMPLRLLKPGDKVEHGLAADFDAKGALSCAPRHAVSASAVCEDWVCRRSTSSFRAAMR